MKKKTKKIDKGRFTKTMRAAILMGCTMHSIRRRYKAEIEFFGREYSAVLYRRAVREAVQELMLAA